VPDSSDNQPIASDLVKEDPTFADLVEEFVAGLDQRVQGMRDAVGGSDFETLKSLAHQLKGAGGGHGYPILTEKAAALEQDAVAEQVDACKTMVDELASLISRVVVSPTT
jgi:histidine phosphotransfer protein HptB